ncbi:MAG: hypothetical protein KAT04_15725, partial [Methylococcales bacterium]|nr:hypothetical protein [Methylococcales bacterium]
PVIKEHLKKVEVIHNLDLEKGYGAVYLPDALEKKYPNANKQFGWQYVFPSRNLSTDPRSGRKRRHHVDQSLINKAIRANYCCTGIRIKPQHLSIVYE